MLSTALASTLAQSRTTILLLGDSLSASYGMVYEQGWVPLLQSKLDTAGLPYRIINASISGETTGGGLARLERLLAEHRPDILWIELGGNDGLRGYPPAAIRANLQNLAQLGQGAGAEVWLTQIHIPPNYGPRYTKAFDAVFAEVASALGLRLLPFILEDVALVPGLLMADGIHPTVEAQPLIAAKVFALLSELAASAEPAGEAALLGLERIAKVVLQSPNHRNASGDPDILASLSGQLAPPEQADLAGHPWALLPVKRMHCAQTYWTERCRTSHCGG